MADPPDVARERRRDERQEQFTRVLTLLGMGITVLFPLLALILAVETGDVFIGAVGLFLAVFAYVLIVNQ